MEKVTFLEFGRDGESSTVLMLLKFSVQLWHEVCGCPEGFLLA